MQSTPLNILFSSQAALGRSASTLNQAESAAISKEGEGSFFSTMALAQDNLAQTANKGLLVEDGVAQASIAPAQIQETNQLLDTENVALIDVLIKGPELLNPSDSSPNLLNEDHPELHTEPLLAETKLTFDSQDELDLARVNIAQSTIPETSIVPPKEQLIRSDKSIGIEQAQALLTETLVPAPRSEQSTVSIHFISMSQDVEISNGLDAPVTEEISTVLRPDARVQKSAIPSSHSELALAVQAHNSKLSLVTESDGHIREQRVSVSTPVAPSAEHLKLGAENILATKPNFNPSASNPQVMPAGASLQPVLIAETNLNDNMLEFSVEHLDKTADQNAHKLDIKSSQMSTFLHSNPVSPLSRSLNPAPQYSVEMHFSNQNWPQAMAEKSAQLVAQKISTAEIQLDPPELGPLQIRVQVHNDQASVNFVAASLHVKEALDLSMLRLRDMLQEQGIELVDSGVSDQPAQGQSQSGERSQARDDFALEGEDSSNTELADGTDKQLNIVIPWGIDYFA